MKRIIICGMTSGLFFFAAGCETLGNVASEASKVGAKAGVIDHSTARTVQEGSRHGKDVDQVREKFVKASEDLDESQEHYIGRAVAAQIFAKYGPWTGEEARRVTQYVYYVMKTIAMSSERPETYGGYHLVVLETEEVNAYAAPGGFIFLTKGLLRQVENEDELAGVLAHEVVHVVKRHGIQAIEDSRWKDAWGSLVVAGAKGAARYTGAELNKVTDLFEKCLEDVVGTILEKGYDPDAEREADRMAVEYCVKAGYSPQGLLDILRRTVGHDEGKQFKTHPGGKERISNVENALPRRSMMIDPARTSRFLSIKASIR